MRVTTWNLERALPTSRRCSAILEQITAVGADIWILTETHQAISPGDGFFSVTSGDPDRPSKPGEKWVAIWTRYPMEPLPSFVSDPARCAAARISHPKLGEIIIFGCVLPWGGSTWRGIKSSHGEAFRAALEMYTGDWQRLRGAYPDAVIIVAGDFNQSLATRHYYGSKRQRTLLEESLKHAGLKVATGGDSDPIYREAAPYACIDHICVTDSPGITLRRTFRWPRTPKPDRRLSDHFGVGIELAKRAGATTHS
jgi:hypothetical protein